MINLRKTIGLLGFCPSCLRWQGIFAFEDYVCATCHESGKDGGAFKKILTSIATAILSYFGYGEYTELNNKIKELENREPQVIYEPALGGVQDKDGDGRITKWDKDNGLPPLMNPKYWSQ